MREIYRQVGYDLLYYYQGKQIASKVIKEKDRNGLGISGEIEYKLTEDITFGNLNLKKGDVVSTMIFERYEKIVK